MKLIGKSGITKLQKTDEWYSPKPMVELMYKLLNPKPNSSIICPFDTDTSNFVKVGFEQGHKVQYGYPTVYVPSRRINYISIDGLQTKANHFHSIILIFNDLLGSRLIWE